MYTAGSDRVVVLAGVPPSDAGAPSPVVLSSGPTTVVAYHVSTTDRKRPAALVAFSGVLATYFGAPNDEAFAGHPLHARGLRPYGAYEVESSSWIRVLAKMNSVHPQHRAEHYSGLRHFVLAFHDETFECVADDFTVAVADGPVLDLVPRMRALVAETE
jgi:hypothetical protein